MLTIYREGAVSVRLFDQAPELSIDFETDDTKGKLEVWIRPARAVETTLLG